MNINKLLTWGTSHGLRLVFSCLLLNGSFLQLLHAQDWEEVLVATASDGDSFEFSANSLISKIKKAVIGKEDGFGYSIAISGDYAIVGAPLKDEDAAGSNTLDRAGAAYIFERIGGKWTKVQQIVASDRAAADAFGRSVAISGDYAIVGAPAKDEDAAGSNMLDRAGSAYIFECKEGNWTEVQKIVALDRAEGDNFGGSVSISGDYAIVGSAAKDEDTAVNRSLGGEGAAYIFERSGGGTWTEVQKIVASDRAAGDHFGNSVSISGDYAIVGATFESEDAAGRYTLYSAGSAYIFERKEGSWTEVQKIVASDRGSAGYFGTSVSISGDYAIVGALYEGKNNPGGNPLPQAGAAYIFERSGGSWTEVQKIVASDRSGEDEFGTSVSISGDYAIVGGPTKDEDAAGSNTLDWAGAAYIFERIGGKWTKVQKILASDRAAKDFFGCSVAISGDYAIVGGAKGAVYFFD